MVWKNHDLISIGLTKFSVISSFLLRHNYRQTFSVKVSNDNFYMYKNMQRQNRLQIRILLSRKCQKLLFQKFSVRRKIFFEPQLPAASQPTVFYLWTLLPLDYSSFWTWTETLTGDRSNFPIATIRIRLVFPFFVIGTQICSDLSAWFIPTRFWSTAHYV